MRREAVAISPVSEIIAEIRAGRIVILVDDEDRENEGDLVFAAEFVSADKINFLAKHGRGLICMPITEEHAARLGLRPMVEQNRSRHGTNFTVSIEAAEGIATGISAHDRALTIKVAAAPEARPEDIVQPGHVFPLIAQRETLVRVPEPLSIVDLLDAGPGTHSWGVGEALAAIREAGEGAMVLLNCTQSTDALQARLGEVRPVAGRAADLRLYGIGAQILRDLGIGRMRLLAAPRKMPSMAGFGLEVTGYVSGPLARAR